MMYCTEGDERMTKVIPALIARTQLGQIMKRAKQKGERFVVDRRGEPQVVIMGVEDYFQHFAPETETMAALRQAAHQKGLDKLTMRDIDRLIKKTRQERKEKRAPKSGA